MNYRRWLNSKFSVFAYCVASLFLLIACGAADTTTSSTGSNYSSNDTQYISNISIDNTTTRAELEADTGGEIILFKPEAGFAVVGFDKPLDSLSTLAGDVTENQDVFSNPEFSSQAFDGSGHSAWAGGHSAWAGGWSAWAGGWSAWAGGNRIPEPPADNTDIFEQINLYEAHEISRNFGAGVTVAVIDTGVDYNHPAIKHSLSPQSSWRDYVDNDNDPYDVLGGAATGHGTGVTGLILQVAPKVKILPIRVLDKDGRGDTDDVLLAIEHAVNHGAKILNLSLGAVVPVGPLQQMLTYAESKGVYTIVSSGNRGADAEIMYPARYSVWHTGKKMHIFGVGSVDSDNNLSTFTSHSSISPSTGDMAYFLPMLAPGEQIYSAYPENKFAYYTGTSFAAPLVSGAIALAYADAPAPMSFVYESTWGVGPITATENYSRNQVPYLVDAKAGIRNQLGWTQPNPLNIVIAKRTLEVSGGWTSSGGPNYTNSGNRKYNFEVTKAGTVTLDLMSKTDTYLYLLDSSGKLINEDDNGGDGKNSRITMYLSEGSYSVVAATSRINRKSSFTLQTQGYASQLRLTAF